MAILLNWLICFATYLKCFVYR